MMRILDISKPPSGAARASAIKTVVCSWGVAIFTIRKIEDCTRSDTRQISFAVTLARRLEQKIEDRIHAFHAALVSSTVDGERVVCENKCFCVQGKGYSVNFVLEVHKKRASRIGYLENGQPKIHYLERTGVDFAFRQHWPYESVPEWRFCWQRMNVAEFVAQHPNPADRFVASIAMERRLDKLELPVWYGSVESGLGDGFSLHPFMPAGQSTEGFSCLSFTEEVASFVLPIVAEVYPDIYDRHYGGNPLPHELWQDVVKRMRELVQLIARNPSSEALDTYVSRVYLDVLQGYGSGDERLLSGLRHDDPDWLKNRKLFLYKNRHRLSAFFSFFADWLANQGKRSISITGS